MSQLRSVIAETTAFEPSDLSPAHLADEIIEALHAAQQLDVAVAAWVKNLTERGGHHDLGYPSPTAFLTDQGRISPGHAKQIIAMAHAGAKARIAHQAWADGRLSTDQARHLFSAADGVPDSYPDAERRLVDIVDGLDPVDTRKAIEYWRQSIDGPGEMDLETQLDRRGLSLSKSYGGMRRIDGWMTESAGQALETAMDANMPPPRDDDVRTPRQRRHDGLENLCRDWLDNGATPTIGGEKPHMSLHADIPALQGIAGGLHETEDGSIVDIDMLRMIACDCSVSRIVLEPDSEILDVGRKTRVWNSAQRRAIVARDRHCQGRGCRAKARHCDIHHIRHWANGGDTAIENGKLLCRPCHGREHLEDGYGRRRRAQG